jgi:hypothetical protein
MFSADDDPTPCAAPSPSASRERDAGGEKRPRLGGLSGGLALVLAEQALSALWHGRESAGGMAELRQGAAVDALRGIAPRDPLEGMLAAQLVATHAAAMEGFRRAAIPEQSFEARQANLGQANRLCRTYAALVEALGRHRGKGQPQVVRVERVTVEAGGQAIVGAVGRGGGGGG